MTSGKVRPRARSVAARQAVPDETSPGDTIELSLTVEVTNKRGQKTWAKCGLASTHREDETTEDAVDRIQSFVVESVEALKQEFK